MINWDWHSKCCTTHLLLFFLKSIGMTKKKAFIHTPSFPCSLNVSCICPSPVLFQTFWLWMSILEIHPSPLDLLLSKFVLMRCYRSIVWPLHQCQATPSSSYSPSNKVILFTFDSQWPVPLLSKGESDCEVKDKTRREWSLISFAISGSRWDPRDHK